MIYFLITIIVLITAFLMLSLRLRVNLESGNKTVFFGLGRSGVEYDFTTKLSSIYLSGMLIKKIKPKDKKEKKPKPGKKIIKAKTKKPKRIRPYKDILKIIPQSSKALGNYSLSILKSVVIEELNGTVKAGFDSPNLTGQVYGYYQAAVGVLPAMAGRLRYIPVWDEEIFEASLKVSVAIPLYKIFYRTIILFIKLPLREIIKLTIGKKERRP